jgi:hypothetical protein
VPVALIYPVCFAMIDTLVYFITTQRLHHSKHSLSLLGTFGHIS